MVTSKYEVSMNRTIHTLEETLIKSLVYLTEAYDCFYQTQRIENILTEGNFGSFSSSEECVDYLVENDYLLKEENYQLTDTYL